MTAMTRKTFLATLAGTIGGSIGDDAIAARISPSHGPRELIIHPEGETHPWSFEKGCYCGEAHDSVGVTLRGTGCVFTRKDVRRLIEFLEQAEREWSPNPPAFSNLFDSAFKLDPGN